MKNFLSYFQIIMMIIIFNGCSQTDTTRNGLENPQGYALLVGLKYVSYGDFEDYATSGCEKDVKKMKNLLLGKELAYDKENIQLLLTEDATHDSVLSALAYYSNVLEPEDILVFYYSGHGDQIADKNLEEGDGKDELLITYDEPIIDDELNTQWKKFKPGVRIVMISDACNSGTNFHIIAHSFEISLEQDTASVKPDSIDAQLIHIGASWDGENAQGGPSGGKFTLSLVKILSKQFNGNYSDFSESLQKDLPQQSISFNTFGPITNDFLNQQPFKIK